MVQSPSKFPRDELTVVDHLQPLDSNLAEGREILRAVGDAYRQLEFYSGTIELTSTALFPTGKHPDRRTFNVRYESPTILRLDGKDSNGDQFIITIDDNSAVVRWNGKTEQFGSPEDVLYAYSGVSLYATVVLAGCLLDISWKNEEPYLPKDKSLIEGWSTKARFEGTALIEATHCDKIVCERETSTWTLFIDKQTRLIKRADYEVTEQQMKRKRERGGGGGASGRLLAVLRSQLFVVEHVEWRTEKRNGQAD
jgi:hypothetical protein